MATWHRRADKGLERERGVGGALGLYRGTGNWKNHGADGAETQNAT